MKQVSKIKTKLKVNDIVEVIAGKDRGSQGKILNIDFVKGKLVVEGINKVKKTVKKTQENQTGGLITQEQPIHISNVMYFDNDSKKRARLGVRVNTEKKKERFPRINHKVAKVDRSKS